MNKPTKLLSSESISQKSLYHRKRIFKDRLARYFVAAGGMSVIVAILLILIYLLYVVIPLFEPAQEKTEGQFPVTTTTGMTRGLAMEEQTEIGARFTSQGNVVFFGTHDGKTIQGTKIPLPKGASISSFTRTDAGRSGLAYGLSNGEAIVARHTYRVTFPEGKRLITPRLTYPLGDKPIEIDAEGKPLIRLAFQSNDEEATLVALTEDKRLLMLSLTKETSLISDEVSISKNDYVLPPVGHEADYILMGKNQHNLFILSRDGDLSFLDIVNKSEPHQVQQIRLVKPGVRITSVRFLTGDLSLLVGDSTGTITQWSLIPDEFHQNKMVRLREFKGYFKGSITDIASEQGRKGFAAVDDKGAFGVFHSTAHRNLLFKQISNEPLTHVTVAPRANAVLVEGKDGKLTFIRVHNEHPEVSWQALWGKVWYESYPKPDYIWQSSSASDDFEPKFSLVPITFGTFKAAFYAMIIAIPLSIFGALYTAQFMQPRMRRSVKPAIEIMEALPTVILGFLAGLWLAPYVETNLPGIFAVLVIMPMGILLASFVWQRVPSSIRHAIPEGWEAALLLPVIALMLWISLGLSPLMENLWFGGDMRQWLTNEVGIGFDQRNSIVVGLAMGFAVIPTIFSIAEDAIFGVPKHLSNGSLALGATPWQTLIRVVLPSASPGIFSAIMIGLGRAVGETMIVLMATGNTPVMDFSPFQGLRTLSANIAVELPESEVDSTHFRVLFLAGLVLFLFTFVVNTIAEVVRQRLRRKYSSL